MDTERQAHWEKVYADKSPLEVSWYQKAPTLSLQLVRSSGVSRDEWLIDVGGGASQLVDSLLDDGYRHVAVLDIALTALEFAKSRLGEKAHVVEWLQADITEFQPMHGYTLWHDRAVFHFLTAAADRRRYVEVLRRAVPVGGQVIIGTFALGGPERCSGLDIVQYDAAKLGKELGAGFELQEQADEVHTTPAGKEQKFSFFRFLRTT
jgi:SAM-dependent methyltransferase